MTEFSALEEDCSQLDFFPAPNNTQMMSVDTWTEEIYGVEAPTSVADLLQDVPSGYYPGAGERPLFPNIIELLVKDEVDGMLTSLGTSSAESLIEKLANAPQEVFDQYRDRVQLGYELFYAAEMARMCQDAG